jgi:hypothetical protein
MKRIAVAILILGAATVLAAPTPARAQPANDDFPGTTITSLPFTDTVDTTGSTDQPGEPFGANQALAVWYNYTPPEDTVLLADLVGSDFGVFVSVYSGSSLDQLVHVDSGGLVTNPGGLVPSGDELSQPAVFHASKGETYYFQAGSSDYPPQTGSLTFNLKEGAPPPNDDFPGTTITGLPFVDTVDTTFATDGDTPPQMSPSVIGPSVWYNYTPPEARTLVVDTQESDYPVYPDIMDIGGYTPQAEIAATEDWQCVVFTPQAGQTIYFRVGAQPIGLTGTLAFKLSEAPPGETPESNTVCPQPATTPFPGESETLTGVDGADGLPRGGGAPPANGREPWPLFLAGALLVLGVVLLVSVVRSLRSSSR